MLSQSLCISGYCSHCQCRQHLIVIINGCQLDFYPLVMCCSSYLPMWMIFCICLRSSILYNLLTRNVVTVGLLHKCTLNCCVFTSSHFLENALRNYFQLPVCQCADDKSNMVRTGMVNLIALNFMSCFSRNRL